MKEVIHVATQQDVIKNFMAALDTTTLKGTAAVNAALQACSNFSTLQEFRNKIVSDCESAGDAQTFLREYCGIIIGNSDTGAITGSDTGNGLVKTAKTIVPESGDLQKFTGNEFTVGGLTVKLGNEGGSSAVKVRSFSNLSKQEKYIWQSFYSYWLENSLDLIGNSSGENFSFNDESSAVTKTLYFVFDNEDNGILAATWGGPSYAQKSANDLELHVNLNFYGTATGGDGIPASNQNYLDRTLAHELTHAVMRANIDYFDYLPAWLKEGMAELTHGVDDKRTSDLRTLAGNSTLLKRALMDLSASGVKSPAYSGGYLALRYLAKQAADTYTQNFSGSDADEQFETENDFVTIDGAGGDDTLGNGFYVSASYSATGGDSVYLRGGDGNDSLRNFGGNLVTLSGGKGNDTIQNSGSNVLFLYEAGDGDDFIQGFDETSTLSISGDIHSTQTEGANVIVTVGDGSVTLKGAASLTTLNIDGNSTIATYDNSSAAKITLASGIVIGDASARTTAIKITGNALDNSILGGSGKDTLYGKAGADYLSGNAGNDKLYGQAGNDYLEGGAGNDLLSGYSGNDTLWGGTGNDTLTGGAGKDVFIYSEGKDVITDYASGDKISIGAAISKSSVKGSDATFIIDSSTLTVKDGFGKELVFVDGDGTERTIVGGTYWATDATPSKATLAAWRELADASERTTAIRIVGNALDNSIVGGSGKDTLYGKDGNDILQGGAGADKLYGQTGDDTLWGGAGNDTLTGGDGFDLFIYSEGKDVITDFGDDDLLQITDTFSATYNSSTNTIAFKVGSTASALTLKNFTASTFNINGDDHTISGSTLAKK